MNWPFDPILSTVVLSNGDELLTSEGYEFGGYLFHPEEMGKLGQFAGAKLKRFGSQPLLGVQNGNSVSSPEKSRMPSLRPTTESKVARTSIHPEPSNGTASTPIRIRRGADTSSRPRD